ncbi:MAG: hypothetical protein ACKN9U_13955, partial [Pirellulaceae bacterium]
RSKRQRRTCASAFGIASPWMAPFPCDAATKLAIRYPTIEGKPAGLVDLRQKGNHRRESAFLKKS